MPLKFLYKASESTVQVGRDPEAPIGSSYGSKKNQEENKIEQTKYQIDSNKKRKADTVSSDGSTLEDLSA